MASSAARRARKLYPNGKNYQTVYLRGVRAAEMGWPESACPYKRDQKKTWSLAYRNAWLRGFQSVPRRVE